MNHFPNKKLELYEINVTLSKDQKQKIRNAFINYEKIRLRLSKDALRGKDTLLVTTSFFEERDGDDPKSLDACVGKKTLDEMRNKMLEEIKCFEDFENIEDEDELKDLNENLSYKKFKKIKSLRDQNLSDEMLENEINEEIWEYYGLFFKPGMDYAIEEGIEFNLNYSLLNDLEEDLVKDLAKDFVKDNIKKLFQ